MGTWNIDPDQEIDFKLNWDGEDTPVIQREPTMEQQESDAFRRPVPAGLECYFHGCRSQAVARLSQGFPICQWCVDHGVPG
jgi:hypothetical protein